MKLGNQQQIAFDKIMHWHANGESRIFTLGGFAGTGKSTLAKYIGEQFESVVYCSFTGKAALNLRQKGIDGACTIHRLIYTPRQSKYGVFFELTPENVIHADLIIIDEYSMVNDKILSDLLSVSKCKILALGDPGQLAPVEGVNTLTPDFVLEEVHRQAMESPVLAAATYVRTHNKLPSVTDKNQHGCFALMRRAYIDKQPAQMEVRFDQLLTDTNASRFLLNLQLRQVRGYPVSVPQKGDKVICLDNKYDIDIYNGQIGTLKRVKESKRGYLRYAALVDFPEGKKDLEFKAHAMFHAELKHGKKEPPHFDYAYAITVHKAQGSEWDNVAVIPTKGSSKEWLYTAITRARKNCAVFL